MSHEEPAPGDSGGTGHDDPGLAEQAEEAEEAALIRKVMREQERHREGGVDADLEVPGDQGAAGPPAQAPGAASGT